jgi:hypothetical protein
MRKLEKLNFVLSVFYLLFRDTSEGGNCERAAPNDTCGNGNMCSFQNFEAWMTMVHFTMGEFDVKIVNLINQFHLFSFHLVFSF